MIGKVIVIENFCKGCGLCVNACSKKCLSLGTEFNSQGYAYVVFAKDSCTGCSFCAEICPDLALRVYHAKKVKGDTSKIEETSLNS